MDDLFNRVSDALYPSDGGAPRVIDLKFSCAGHDGIASRDLLEQAETAYNQIRTGQARRVTDLDGDLTPA